MSPREVVPVPVVGAAGSPVLEPLRAALSGAGPAVHAHPRDVGPAPAAVAALDDDEDSSSDPVAAVVSTSGSSGAAKHVLLPASAVLASAAATHDRLGGAGTWLLCVPAHSVAGLMVLARSLVARTEPVVVDLQDGFRVDGFVAGASAMAARGRLYTSLVPTQLRRLLGGGAPALEALRRFDAVLVGGSALDGTLRGEAEAAGVRVVATYGMTETCGGCVYDRAALPGVHVAVAPDGRVRLGGPVVARGYRRGGDLPDAGTPGGGSPDFTVESGRRWFRTPDTGTLVSGRLEVSGRVDDVAVSGGVNVPLAPVQRVVRRLPGVGACVVVAVPDQEWGQVVGVLVEPLPPGDGGTGEAEELLAAARTSVARELGRASAPRLLLVVPELPLLGVGKPDRARARELLLGPGAARTGPTGDHGSRDDDGGTCAT